MKLLLIINDCLLSLHSCWIFFLFRPFSCFKSKKMLANEILCNILDFCEPQAKLTKLNKDFEKYLYQNPLYSKILHQDLKLSLKSKDDQRFYELFCNLKNLNGVDSDLLAWTVKAQRFDVFDFLLKDFRLHKNTIKDVCLSHHIIKNDLANFFQRLIQWKPPRGYKKYHKIRHSEKHDSQFLVIENNYSWMFFAIDNSSIKVLKVLIPFYTLKDNFEYLVESLKSCCRKQKFSVIELFLISYDWPKKIIKDCIMEHCIKMNITSIFPLLISCKKFGSKYYTILIVNSLKAKRFQIFDHIYLTYVINNTDVMLEVAVKSLIKHPNLNSLKMMISQGLSPDWNNNWLIQKTSQRGLLEFVEYLVQFDNIDVRANNNFAWRKAKGSCYYLIVELLENHPSFFKFLPHCHIYSFYE